MYYVRLPRRLDGLEGLCPRRFRHQPLIPDELNTENKHSKMSAADKRMSGKRGLIFTAMVASSLKVNKCVSWHVSF